MAATVFDSIAPKELILRNAANAALPSTAQKGTIMYDSTNDKLMVWTGAGWETVTSA